MKITTRELPPTHQSDAALNQAAPVQNTWYTVLNTVGNARIYGIATCVRTTGETVAVRITIDGNTLTGAISHNADAIYYWIHDFLNNYLTVTKAIYCQTGITESYERGFLIEGRSIKVEVRKTTANGAGNLTAKVIYGLYR